jgi:hypothetical protein
MMVSCVGLAKMPRSFRRRHTSYVETLAKPEGKSSTALSRPRPRTSFTKSGYVFCTDCNWARNRSPNFSALEQQHKTPHPIIPFIKTSTNKSSSGSQHSCVFPPPIKKVHNFHITLSLLSIVAPSAISVIKGFKVQSSPASFLKFRA